MGFEALWREIGPNRCRAWCAIMLSGIRTLPEAQRGNASSFHGKLLERQRAVIHALNDFPSDFRVELRYIYKPDKPFTVQSCIFVSSEGKDEGEATRRTKDFCEFFMTILSVNNLFHEFTPVSSTHDIMRLLKPFAVGSITEIVRREGWLPLDAMPKSDPRLLGFAKERQSAQKARKSRPSSSNIYYIAPYDPPVDSLQSLFTAFLQREEEAYLSVCLMPYKLTQTDEKFMEGRITLCEKYAQLQLSSSEEPEELSPYLRKQAELLYGYCSRDFFRLRDAAFLMNIRLATPKTVPLELITVAGAGITKPAGHPDGSGKSEHSNLLEGGYDYFTTNMDAQRTLALESILDMEFKSWIPSVAPPALAHWRYLCDVNQAVSAFRLPFPIESEFPGIETLQFQPRPLHTSLPSSGLSIGLTALLNKERQVYLSPEDRKRHAYVVGKTGTGKSTLFLNMIVQDIMDNRGVGVIDPHGELIESVLECIPSERIKDCVLISPSDFDNPIGINMLDAESGLQKDFCINYLMEVFELLYDLKQTGGPIFEMYMRNALQLLLDQPLKTRPTVMDVPRLFQYSKYRRDLLDTTDNAYVKDFWIKEAEKAGGEISLQNVTPYITSKLCRFVYNSTMRGILGQRQSTIDFRGLMDNGGILLVDLRKGLLGDTNSHFLGMLVVGKILTAALSRTGIKEKKGAKDFYLYVDEFQNLATPSFVSILSEARKYGLALTITNQYVSQLKEEIVHGILGNVGSLLSFRVGSEDARLISNEFGQIVSPGDLMGLSKWKAYARLLIDGNTSAPFTIQTVLPEFQRSTKTAEEIRAFSRKKYGKPRSKVEAEIMGAWGGEEETDN